MSALAPRWESLKAWLIPATGWLLFYLQHSLQSNWLNLLLLPLLIACTLQAVHHAEVIASKVGQPFGTLVLALAVTAIESSLIVSMMEASGEEGTALARDTVFAAVMIILNGLMGMSMLAGSHRYSMQSFLPEGVNAALTTLVAISVLTLILPNFTVAVHGPLYSNSQLLFVSIVSLILYGTFLFVQNLKHREFFLTDADNQEDEIRPNRLQTTTSVILLFVNLGAVVAMAESLAGPLDNVLDKLHAPRSIAGIIIAIIILLPEGLSAVRAAKNNQLQKSLNLLLGSALASIGLTIPIVAVYAIYRGVPLTLGINQENTILFLLSIFMVIMSLRTGRTTVLQGAVLLIVFLVYLFLTVIP